MANALEALLKALRSPRLPRDYPYRSVSAALTMLEFTETSRGSHFKWSKPGHDPIVIKVDNGKVPVAAMRDLRALFTKLRLLK